MQPLVKTPCALFSDSGANVAWNSYEAEIRALAGYGFKWDPALLGSKMRPFAGQYHFADLEVAYRKRNGELSDQVKIDGTLGFRFNANILVLGQFFSVVSTGKENVGKVEVAPNVYRQRVDNYGDLKLQLSGVVQATKTSSLQIGVYGDALGKNYGAGQGMIISLWKGFEMEKLGAFLHKQAYLTEASLQEFRKIAVETGRNIASVILSHGRINPHELYSKIAQYQNLEFADLQKQPCDASLLDANRRDEYLEYSAIPWKKQGDITIIATSEATIALENWAHGQYNDNYKFAIATPFDISQSVSNIFAAQNSYEAREKLYEMNPSCSAKKTVSWQNLMCFAIVVLALVALTIKFPMKAMAIAFVITSVFYTATMLFKSILLLIGYFAGRSSEQASLAINSKDKELPIYTILVPLYREEASIGKLVKSLHDMDYPKSKLDIKLIVEDDDEITINAIKKLRPLRIFEIIKVPYSQPRTKPKACNYALRFARGEFVTIYDAEDMPEPDQLKKVLYKFQNGDNNLACVQARLNYFNHSENLLTRMFAIEYSVLFDFMMFGLEKIGIPIPLGGTSNHFRTEMLRQLYAWDPYNVTEDADLGLRISQEGWKSGMVWSCTDEEAPISLWAWIKQRTRWIKGHMQTYLVHMRQPFSLYKKIGLMGFMGMQFFFGAPTLIFLISPIMWVVWAMFMLGIFRFDVAMPGWFNAMVAFSIYALLLGVVLQILFAVAAVARNKWRGMWIYSLLFPFYWVLHSVASFRALWQLVKCPHYWEKTTHGVTKISATLHPAA